jgi:hypothetical protein
VVARHRLLLSRLTCHDVAVTICSAKGCSLPARHQLIWNNRRLHTPDREKVWLACDDHLGSLSQHLDVRGFLRRVDPFPGAGSD